MRKTRGYGAFVAGFIISILWRKKVKGLQIVTIGGGKKKTPGNRLPGVIAHPLDHFNIDSLMVVRHNNITPLVKALLR
jgi:hypothetical protein